MATQAFCVYVDDDALHHPVKDKTPDASCIADENIRLKIWKILVGLNSHALAEAAQRLLNRAVRLVLKLEELAVLNAGGAPMARRK